MSAEESQRTQELLARLSKLRQTRKEAEETQAGGGLADIAKKIDAEILKINEELQSQKFKKESEKKSEET